MEFMIHGRFNHEEPIPTHDMHNAYQTLGDLLNYLRSRQKLVENTGIMIDMVTQIASAMQYLEKNGFIHCDLVQQYVL